MSTRMRVLSISPIVLHTPVPATPVESRQPYVDYRNLPRLGVLVFSGKIEEWPEFCRDWKARYGNLKDDVQIQYLKPALPTKDQSKISGVSTMAESSKRLEETYGDRTLNIVTVKNNIRSF